MLRYESVDLIISVWFNLHELYGGTYEAVILKNASSIPVCAQRSLHVDGVFAEQILGPVLSPFDELSRLVALVPFDELSRLVALVPFDELYPPVALVPFDELYPLIALAPFDQLCPADVSLQALLAVLHHGEYVWYVSF